MQDELLREPGVHLRKLEDVEIYVTGHSLGGAVATLFGGEFRFVHKQITLYD